MKYFFLLLIGIYQKFFSSFLKQILGTPAMCKFSPTCSEYARQMVQKHGAAGVLMGIKRMGECR